MSKTMSNTNNFGLVAKTKTTKGGGSKTLNAKLIVPAEFYDEYTSKVNRIATKYSGGSCAILLSLLQAAMPELRAMADAIDLEAAETKGGAK